MLCLYRVIYNEYGNLHIHCLLVFADLTLTTDRLMELFQSVEDPDNAGMYDISIGESLGLSQSTLEEIRRSYQSNTKCKEAYLDTYAQRYPWPSWKRISEVLWNCGLNQQAKEVENTYVQGMHTCTYIDLWHAQGHLSYTSFKHLAQE